MATEMIGALSVDLRLDSQKFTQGTGRAQKSMKTLQGAAKRSSRTMQVMDRSLAGLSRSVGTMGGPFGSVAGQVGNLRAGLTSMNPVLAITVGSMALLGAATSAGLKAFSDAEQGMLKTEALLKATGNASGFTATQLDEMARSTARATLASAEQIRTAQGVLLTFKSISGQNFEKTISLAQDMAAVFGGDAKSSATQLGKALEDPIKGLSSLNRVGVTFNETQKKVIHNLVETGRTAEAQREILKTLESQVGGAGTAEAGGLAGAFDSLTQASSELFENWVKVTGIGKLVTDTVNSVATSLNKTTSGMAAAGSIEWYEEQIKYLEKINFFTRQSQNMKKNDLANLREKLGALQEEEVEDV